MSSIQHTPLPSWADVQASTPEGEVSSIRTVGALPKAALFSGSDVTVQVQQWHNSPEAPTGEPVVTIEAGQAEFTVHAADAHRLAAMIAEGAFLVAGGDRSDRGNAAASAPGWAQSSEPFGEAGDGATTRHSAGMREIGMFDADVLPCPGPVSLELLQFDNEGFPRIAISTLDSTISLTAEGARALAHALVETAALESAKIAEGGQR